MEYDKGKRIKIEIDKGQERGGRAHDIHENPEKKKIANRKGEKKSKINGKVKKKAGKINLSSCRIKHDAKKTHGETGEYIRVFQS